MIAGKLRVLPNAVEQESISPVFWHGADEDGDDGGRFERIAEVSDMLDSNACRYNWHDPENLYLKNY